MCHHETPADETSWVKQALQLMPKNSNLTFKMKMSHSYSFLCLEDGFGFLKIYFDQKISFFGGK